MTTITISNYESVRSDLINTTSLKNHLVPEDITKKFSLKEVTSEAPRGLYEESENILDKGVSKLYSGFKSLVLSDKETILFLPELTEKSEQTDSIPPVEKNKSAPYIFRQFYAKNAPAVQREPDDAEPQTNLESATTVASTTRKSNFEKDAEKYGITTNVSKQSKEVVSPQKKETISIFDELLEPQEMSKTTTIVAQPKKKSFFDHWFFTWFFSLFK